MARRVHAMLVTCQSGFEDLLARELSELRGLIPAERGPGWVRLAADAPAVAEDPPAFAHLVLIAPREVTGTSVNGLAAAVADGFIEGLQGRRVDEPWSCVWQGPAGLVGLGRRIAAVEAECRERIRRRLARVARLATSELPRAPGPSRSRGLFVQFTDFGRAWFSLEAIAAGPRRMADDPRAPSRSYLKVEEAFGVLGAAPAAGETVCDLGAAPGGWSFSAAERGARVVAVDNGPLKGGALGHPRIEHRREDAFGFAPAAGGCDWLLCDLVEEPERVLRHLVEPWLARGWCRAFVVNLKFGRVDPVRLLRDLRAPGSFLPLLAPGARVLHLFHDREEFTVLGRPASARLASPPAPVPR